MTDLEMTQLCAKAMGLDGFIPCTSGPFASNSMLTKRDGEQSVIYYSPLNNDAQAMALVKRLELCCAWQPCIGRWWVHPISGKPESYVQDLNRAIVECVAKMQTTR